MGSCSADYVDTAYDTNGRVYSISNPHRSTSFSSDGTTYNTSFDGLDRPLIITNQDGTTRQFSYSTSANPVGAVTTETDENGNQWSRITNGIGQLIYVFEGGWPTLTQLGVPRPSSAWAGWSGP